MTMQKEMPFIGAVKHPERVPAHLIGLCTNSGGAVLLSIKCGGKTPAKVARALGMPASQMSRIISGSHHFPADKAVDLAYATGNWAWAQWIAHETGHDLVRRQESMEEKLLRLEVENAELKARSAA